ncbi:histidine kinase [Actinomyces lilanjuaniae]|uniref:histidine kinase n=1 Tax=Actinomyces lilanjuaniae TaxID=2321394 RepID=A0ABN5PSS6_9ACTO|nr:histidine kinase [Actinomyces lilanjuaniae]AYD90984.1 histidine kinase [Actinomyces lilanjuaniae]
MPDSSPSLDTAPAQAAPVEARDTTRDRGSARHLLRGLARSLTSWYRSHPTWVDGTIAVAVLLTNILMAHLALHQYGESLSSVPALVARYPLALAAWLCGAMALTLRRRHPVVAWLALLTLLPLYEQLLLWVHRPPTTEEFGLAAVVITIFAWLGVPITLGTVAARSRPLTTWAAWITTMAVFYLTAVFIEGYPATSGQTLQVMLQMTLIFLVTVLTGLNLRSARLRVTEVEVRSSRLALAREQEALLAASNERSRIAREMHDVVAHSLAVMITMADGAAATIDRDPATARKALETLAETGRGALADTRRLVGVLREDPALTGVGQDTGSPPVSGDQPSDPTEDAPEVGGAPPPPGPRPAEGAGDTKGNDPGPSRSAAARSRAAQTGTRSSRSPEVRDLPVPEFAPPGTVAAVEPSAPIADLRREATDHDSDSSAGATPLAPAPEQADIAGLVERFRAAGVPVDYTWSGEALPEDKALQLTVFRIAQEALTNILRYAPTSPRVAVTVERHTGTAVLTVDNEAAPGARPMHGSGKGLIGMRERAAVYGGSVQAGPTATGWRVRAVLRWDEKNEGTLSWQMPL